MGLNRFALAAVAGAALAGGSVLALAGPAEARWEPQRPITLIVPWGAGGGTDTVARTLAAAMERELGQPINVVNRTGGSGVIGHAALASARPDGYTIGTINVDLSQQVCQGTTDLKADRFTQLALINMEPAGISVDADSEFRTIGQLLDAIRSRPAGSFTASGTGQGGIWHLALAGWLVSSGIEPAKVRWVPAQGEGPALNDLAAGSIHMATPPLSTALPLVQAGQIRPLATMGAARFEPLPDVPTLAEATGNEWRIGTWRMIGAPAGLPADVRDRLAGAVEAAYNSREFVDFMNNRGFARTWMGPQEARAFHASEDQAICTVMRQAGMVN
jgi:tripartite-type tricarboxylate transporter receptor subunit TctC